ncbi:MAG: YIP1 family protein [Candidatus Aminicenantes bacterium]|jgi:Yip1 domain|nr:YIP1 family protein [Candidatus Aminicenantes bacterium]MCK4760426.1 YIP1 family protein [Candidatus Aminicenantes bacterium]
MNFFDRLQGVFFNPKDTFKAVAEKPVWLDALIVILVIITIFLVIISPYLQKDQIQVLKNNVEIQERLGEEGAEQQLKILESKWYRLIGLVILPSVLSIAILFLQPLILLAMSRMVSTEGNYKQVLSVYLHANLIDKILGSVVRLILILTRKSVMQTTTTLAIFFPRMEVTSTGFIVLSQVDFFQLWMFGILGYGLSYVFKINTKKALFISYGFWFLKTLFNVGLGLLGSQFGG